MVHIRLSVKYIVLALNSFFAAAGLVILGVSTAVQLQMHVALDMIDGLFSITPLMSMVMGAVMLLAALLGCGGVFLYNRTMIVMYTILLAVLIIGEVTLAIVIFLNTSKFENVLIEALDDAFIAENKETFHILEAALRCCGNRGPSSYGAQPIPPSCCSSSDASTCGLEEVYERGCNDLIVNRLYSFASIVGSITIAAAALKVSLCLLPLIGSEEEVKNLEENKIEAKNNTTEKEQIQ